MNKDWRLLGTGASEFLPGGGNAPDADSVVSAQRLSTKHKGGQPPTPSSGAPAHISRDTSPAHISYSDPGDGYDSAIRWHADLERGNL